MASILIHAIILATMVLIDGLEVVAMIVRPCSAAAGTLFELRCLYAVFMYINESIESQVTSTHLSKLE